MELTGKLLSCNSNGKEGVHVGSWKGFNYYCGSQIEKMGLRRDVRKGLGPMKILFWRVNCKRQQNATWTLWLHRVFRGMYIREFEKTWK